MAIAATAFLLLLFSPPDIAAQAAPPEETVTATVPEIAPSPREAVGEATGTVRDLLRSFYGFLPKVGIAAAILMLAALVARAARWLLRASLRSWSRAGAAAALAGVFIWLLAGGAALSVLAGDARALVGSVGLAGLALSWALQAPIESFAGWLINAFKGYYRVGDRIAVGDIFGDVYRIDVLNTTLWEAGGPDRPVQGAQPTGVLITFPNSEVLRANIANLTRDFPYVWDEVATAVANESELAYAKRVVEATAKRVLGPEMSEPIETYGRMLELEGLALEMAQEPQVFVSVTDAFTLLTVRYLVPARQRRRWSSDLLVALSEEIAKPEHRGRILPGYPRAQVDLDPRASIRSTSTEGA